MKIAIVYNRESQKVINLFGIPSREKYGLNAIKRITDALKKGGHQVTAFEGDKDLIDNLQSFMPQALKGERPGMVFNLSYGIQGQARYTHVPGMLEMVGIPYVGSGPLAHSLALDKVVAKMIFQQHGLPTPQFAVFSDPGFETPPIGFPMIVKPKNESVSFGIRICNDEAELRDAAGVIFDQFGQAVLCERFIDGREINVGVLGNGTPEAFPPAELMFDEGPKIYTEADKKHKSGREIRVVCPAPLDDDATKRAQDLGRAAFASLGCYDCARIDMRLDDDGNFYILEINSLPSLGEHGSYTQAAAAAGLDFTALVNRLVEVASARYFGTPTPPRLRGGETTPADEVFSYLTQRRDQLEKRVGAWTSVSSRTSDSIGIGAAAKELDARLREAGMVVQDELTDGRSVWGWETAAGFSGGTLLVGHLDVPLGADAAPHAFRRDPEHLFGEGVARTRAAMAMLELALRAIRARRLKNLRLGVLYYADEGLDCRYSRDTITKASARAARVLVLRPGTSTGNLVIQRRGQRRYRLRVEGPQRRLGHAMKRPDPLQWFCTKVSQLTELSSRKARIAVAPIDVHTKSMPMLLPHQVDSTVMVSYPDSDTADEVDARLRERLGGDKVAWSLELLSDRPPMPETKSNNRLAEQLRAVAAQWDLPLQTESSMMPSVAGLVPGSVPVVCGVGPAAHDLQTTQEAVPRISLVQRTLLLAEYLVAQLEH